MLALAYSTVADLDAEQPGLLVVGQHATMRSFDRLDLCHALALDEHVIDAVVEPLGEHVGASDTGMRVFQRDADLVGEPDPDHVVHERARRDPQRACGGVVGEDHPRGHYGGPRRPFVGSAVSRILADSLVVGLRATVKVVWPPAPT